MVKFKLSFDKFCEEKVQAYVAFCKEDSVITNPDVQELCNRFFSPLKEVIEKHKFIGKSGEELVTVTKNNGEIVHLILLGLGKLPKAPHSDLMPQNILPIEFYRRAIGKLIKLSKKHKISSISINLSNLEFLETNVGFLIKNTVETCKLADYKFDKFLTTTRQTCPEIEISMAVPKISKNECEIGLIKGEQIGHAVNKAREWTNLPANFISPKTFVEQAELTAISRGLKIKIFGREDIIKMGMGGIYAVSKGSIEEPKLLVMEYHAGENAQTVAIVGKGVTFDSGGLSLKPPLYMEKMKGDMAGGATTVATMEVIGHIKPNVNVIAVVPLAENMPSGSAMRPDDIISFYNGKTAEIKNTDAEGRLILADALAYTVENYKPDAIIDLATLTGACFVALGPFFAGIMSRNDKLIEQFIKSSRRSGDQIWRLPLHDGLKASIKSDVADIANAGRIQYRAGTITAGLFLENFVKDTPWAHIDIAGTAFDVPDISYQPKGATGFGVRLLVDLITHWKALK